MNPRLTTGVVGAVTVLLALVGLLAPERVVSTVLGFGIQSGTHPLATLGEVRATYGGVFLVLGVYTLLAARNPAAQAGRLVFIALVWLGACAARGLGAFVDGDPGLLGWLSGAFELAMGGALLLATRTPAAPAVEPYVAAPAAAPPAAQA
jgi:hypothetical protein